MELKYLIAIFASLCLSFAYGQEDSEGSKHRGAYSPVHPLTDMPDASEDIVTSFYYPKYPDLRFPAGEIVTVLCSVRNQGDSPYNITAMMGSLNAPFNFDYHLQNYTLQSLGVFLTTSQEITFEYTFKLHENLDPSEYQLAHTVFYENSEEAFSTTFFNKTVEVYLPPIEIDWGSILKTMIVLFGIGATVFITFFKKPEKSSAPVVAADGKPVSNDWTDGFLGDKKKRKNKRA